MTEGYVASEFEQQGLELLNKLMLPPWFPASLEGYGAVIAGWAQPRFHTLVALERAPGTPPARWAEERESFLTALRKVVGLAESNVCLCCSEMQPCGDGCGCKREAQ